MKLNDAKNILFGNVQVKKVYLGDILIWPKSPPEPTTPEGYIFLDGIKIPEIPETKKELAPFIVTDYYRLKSNNRYEIEITPLTPKIYAMLFSQSGYIDLEFRVSIYDLHTYALIRNSVNTPNAGQCEIDESLIINEKYKISLYEHFCKVEKDGIYQIKSTDDWRGYNVSLADWEGSVDIPRINIGPFSASLINYLNGSYIIHKFEIYEGDTIVRQFLPVLRVVDNEVGMLEMITKKFYMNALKENEEAIPFEPIF